jgi:lysophospholipase L1-like esterase
LVTFNIQNKKINFLGDSITEGCGVSCIEHIYLNLLKEDSSLAVARNYGIGGTRIAAQQHPSDPICDKDFISRVDEMDAEADIVVVFGGTNDFGHGDAPLGTFNDRTAYTFYGACHMLMESLINKYPFATIVFMTPLHRNNEDNLKGDGLKEKDVAGLSTYVNIIIEVAIYYSIPVLDLFALSGIQPRVPIIQELYCPDGLHPNDEGHKIIAARLKGFLSAL